MDVISKNIETIFRNEKDGKVFYSIGMPTKNKDGSYNNDYGDVRFKSGIEPTDKKTKIRIKNAWLKSYKNHLYVFINDYEKVEETKKQDGWVNPKDIEIPDSELPF